MSRSIMRLEGEELACFHANYVYMWKKLNTAPYYVSGFGEPPAWIHGAELLPSYVNLSKCMNPDYEPSINLVNKIVHFYNANIAPSIDTYTFLHETLELNDRGRTALACTSAEPFCGLYYGYYYSEAEDEKYIRGALLKVFEHEGELRANLIFDIISDEDLQSLRLRTLLEQDKLTNESFSALKDSMPLNRRLMAFFTGAGKMSPGVLAFQLAPADRDGEYLSLYMPASEQNGEYIGGLGMAFIVTPDRAFHIFRTGFERAGHKDLKPMSLDDPKLKELLAINKGNNERVSMAPADNTAWTNYMVLREQ